MKKFPAWVWIVVGVVALALIAGLVWGIVAMFSGGKSFALNSKNVVDDVEVEYVGDWEEQYGTFVNADSSCGYYVIFTSYGYEDVDGDDVDGSIDEQFEELMEDEGMDIDAERLSNLTVKDINGESVEFAVFQMSGDNDWGTNSGVFAVHPFSDSGDALSISLTCMNEEVTLADFQEQLDNTEFELILPKD